MHSLFHAVRGISGSGRFISALIASAITYFHTPHRSFPRSSILSAVRLAPFDVCELEGYMILTVAETYLVATSSSSPTSPRSQCFFLRDNLLELLQIISPFQLSFSISVLVIVALGLIDEYRSSIGIQSFYRQKLWKMWLSAFESILLEDNDVSPERGSLQSFSFKTPILYEEKCSSNSRLLLANPHADPEAAARSAMLAQPLGYPDGWYSQWLTPSDDLPTKDSLPEHIWSQIYPLCKVPTMVSQGALRIQEVESPNSKPIAILFDTAFSR